jgi:hypothetical protein
MRTILLLLVISLFAAAPAEARKKHRAKHKARRAAVVHVQPRVHPSTSGEDYAKAEAELAELRSTRELPVTTLENQSSDGEVPGSKVR